MALIRQGSIRPGRDEYPQPSYVSEPIGDIVYDYRSTEQAYSLEPSILDSMHRHLRTNAIYPLWERYVENQNLLRSERRHAPQYLLEEEAELQGLLNLHFLHAFWLVRIAPAPQYLLRPFFLGQLGQGAGWPPPIDASLAVMRYLEIQGFARECSLTQHGRRCVRDRYHEAMPVGTNRHPWSDLPGIEAWQPWVFTQPIPESAFSP